MRKIVRSMMIVPCVLASAACAHDRVFAPEPALQPASAALVVREPIYIVDGVVLQGPPADIEAMDIVSIDVIKVTGPGAPGTVRITTRAGRAP